MYEFSKDSVLLCLASEYYNENKLKPPYQDIKEKVIKEMKDQYEVWFVKVR